MSRVQRGGNQRTRCDFAHLYFDRSGAL